MRTISKSTNTPLITHILIYTGLNLITGILAVFTLTYFPQFQPFLIFIPTIALCAWYGGFIVGFATTIISELSMTFLFFYSSSHPFLGVGNSLFVEMCLFIFIGIFISYIIHIAKQQDKITDYQRRLRQSHHVVETLEKSYDNAQAEIKARDQFLAIASHELKTPVTSMLLQVQSAIHNIRNVSLANFSVANLLKMLEDTEQQSKRLSKMVNDLLDLSLITTGKIDLEIEEANISKIVNAVADRFSSRLQTKQQITVLTNKPVIAYCDKLRMEQAIVNLISNALKYGNNKPISIQVNSTADKARIQVSDQGIGIALEQQRKIFNRFERAVSSRDYKGLGVGLYITYQIVKAHHGKIHLHSQLNKGATFTLEIPLKQPTK